MFRKLLNRVKSMCAMVRRVIDAGIADAREAWETAVAAEAERAEAGEPP